MMSFQISNKHEFWMSYPVSFLFLFDILLPAGRACPRSTPASAGQRLSLEVKSWLNFLDCI